MAVGLIPPTKKINLRHQNIKEILLENNRSLKSEGIGNVKKLSKKYNRGKDLDATIRFKRKTTLVVNLWFSKESNPSQITKCFQALNYLLVNHFQNTNDLFTTNNRISNQSNKNITFNSKKNFKT